MRIFPLYYGIMLALLAVEPLAHWRWTWSWLVWPAYVGNFARFFHPYSLGDPLQQRADFQLEWAIGLKHFTFYMGHFWSLCLEEQFYWVWPWLVFWIRDRTKLLWICAATLPICLGMRIFGQHLLPYWLLDNEILYRATPFRMDALLIGGVIALASRGPHGPRIRRGARKALPIALTVTLLWLLFAPTGHLWQRPYPYPSWKFTWGLSACDILSGLLILVSIQPGSLLFRALSARPLRWIGRVSYGAYVLHDIPHSVYLYAATMFVRYMDAGWHISDHARQYVTTFIAAMIALGSTLVLAWLSFRFFESPFLNMKERWTGRPLNGQTS